MCGCGDDKPYLTCSKLHGTCDIECSGDGEEMCGGASAFELLKLIYAD